MKSIKKKFQRLIDFPKYKKGKAYNSEIIHALQELKKLDMNVSDMIIPPRIVECLKVFHQYEFEESDLTKPVFQMCGNEGDAELYTLLGIFVIKGWTTSFNEVIFFDKDKHQITHRNLWGNFWEEGREGL